MTKADDFDLKDFLPYLLNQAADASSNGFQSYYKAKYGMLRTEWRVLFHLGRYGRMTAKEICDRAGIHKTKVSRAVHALERKRFLKRTEMPQDRRHEVLQLSRTGLAAYKDLSVEAKRYDRELMLQVPAAQRDMLRACLRQIANMD